MESTSDRAHLYVSACVPPLGGAEPSPYCPLCGKSRTPPESDDGIPPPEQWIYHCESGYALPEDPQKEQVWEPYSACFKVATPQVLSWIRDFCQAKVDLAPVAVILAKTVTNPAPYPSTGRPPLRVGLPPVRGEAVSDSCPICLAPTNRVSDGFHGYTCGGLYWVTSHRPGPNRTTVPMTWADFHSCEEPPVSAILRALRDRKEADWIGVLDEALAALPKP